MSEDRLLFDGPRATYGRFRVLHQIGAGSVGPVFRGEDGETRQPVVIKVIRVGLAPERVAIVAAALSALTDRLPPHPALAPVVATGVVDVEPFIVSPFVDGDSLDVALREYGPANMADALPRLRQLADALDAAAAVGATHGSLHLRDIIVSVQETMLTGVGVASVLERVGVRPPVRRPYCAPEVALGHGISPASDQYALAAIAHEWLSGRRLSGSGAAGFQVPASSDAGAAALRTVFERALHESPEARFPTATAFVEAIADLADHAAPRSKVTRRGAAAEAPRLSFDDASEPLPPPVTTFERDFSPQANRLGLDAATDLTGDDGRGVDDDIALVTDGDVVDDEVATDDAAADLLDVPLHAAPTTGRLEWDATEPVPTPAFVSFDDEALDEAVAEAAAPRPEARLAGTADDEWTAPPIRRAPVAVAADAVDRVDREQPDEPETREADEPDGDPAMSDRTWLRWAALIAVMTLAVVGGGWLLLRWGTPSRVAVSSASTTVPAAVNEPPADAPAARTTPSAPPPAAPTATITERPAATPPAAAAPSRATPDRPAPTVAPAPRRVTPPAASAPTPTRPAASVPRPATKAAPVAGAGRVLVRSTPAGAEVFVNGARRGVTPLALRDLPFGAYAVRVVRPGFAPAEQRVSIDAGRPARAVEFALTRAGATPAAATARPAAAAATAAPGSLVVESRPAGARVTIDGTAAGITPLTVPSLPPGAHTVRIALPGYLPITTTARVEARTRARVAVTLTAERPR